MITIYKYSIPGHCEGRIRQVLQINQQYGKPVVWVMLDDTLPYRSIDFYKIGTRWELRGEDEETMRNSSYIGTVKDEEGYIWHCFCVATEPENIPIEDKMKDMKSAAAASPDVEASAEESVG